MTFTLLTLAVLSADPSLTPLQQGMRENLAQITSVLPYLQRPDAFRDPENAQVISAAIDVLSHTRHLVKANDSAAVQPIASLFADAVAQTRFDFDRNDKEIARMRLIGLTRMCGTCHAAGGEQSVEGLASTIDALQLTPLQRAQLYASTRQLGRATAAWSKALAAKPRNDVERFEQAAALRLGVATLTHSDSDPAEVIALVSAQVGRTDFPAFVSRAMKRWLADARVWRAERFDASKQTTVGLLARAETLVTQSGALRNVLNDDDTLVLNMRAAAYAQRALGRHLKPADEARALYLLAVAIAAASDATLWQLDVLYLERCVHLVPHSAQGQKCVERLAERLGFAFNGSAGGSLPSGFGQRLGELRALARP